MNYGKGKGTSREWGNGKGYGKRSQYGSGYGKGGKGGVGSAYPTSGKQFKDIVLKPWEKLGENTLRKLMLFAMT